MRQLLIMNKNIKFLTGINHAFAYVICGFLYCLLGIVDIVGLMMKVCCLSSHCCVEYFYFGHYDAIIQKSMQNKQQKVCEHSGADQVGRWIQNHSE